LINPDEANALEVTRIDTNDVSLRYYAPESHWTQMSDAEHFVQFYEGEDYLLGALGGFIGQALTSGDAALVIATQAHRDGLDKLLAIQGLDLNTARTTGQYLSLDAAETLSKFMVDGNPEPLRFKEVVGNVLGDHYRRTRSC
jgi:DcmR-like sensory protein